MEMVETETETETMVGAYKMEMVETETMVGEVEDKVSLLNGAIPFQAVADPRRGRGRAPDTFQGAPRRMMQMHQEIIRLSLMGTLNNREIAGLVGCSSATVNTVMKDGASAEKLIELQSRRDDSAVDFAKEIRALVPEAIRVYEEVILSRDIDIKNKIHVADQIMDRGGLPRQSSISATVLNSHVSEADIAELKAAGIDAARKQGILVDVDAPTSQPLV